MNRIILIGNGFDLAHGLKTSYRDFIDDYWNTFILKNICDNGAPYYEDENIYLEIEKEALAKILTDPSKLSVDSLKNDIEIFKENSRYTNSAIFRIKNNFLEQISNFRTNKNWVDIENEYYEILKKCNHDKAVLLNKEFTIIEKLLQKYLIKIQKETKIIISKFPLIKNKIYSLISIEDLSKEDFFISEIESELDELSNININTIDRMLNDCKYTYNHMRANSTDIKRFIFNYQKEFELDSELAFDYIKDMIANNTIPDYFMLPKSLLLLNFNYTPTHHQYISKIENFQTIHIHGELNNPNNPIIFGYGDELAEDYKQIENLNDNEYLKNVKSIRYLETDNYRKMLSFIESEPYQIFIMGHSCGNSDRTLLNTLFEHKNCVSIKPFYHLREDGTDNYNEIVQNISRNFTNKAAMRERVVNKTYCEPLT